MTVQHLITILPQDCTKGEAAQIAKAILNTLNLDNEDIILLEKNHELSMDDPEVKTKLVSLLNDLYKIKGEHIANEFITQMYFKKDKLSPQELEKLYQNAPYVEGNRTPNITKQDMIQKGYNKNGTLVVVKKGDSIDSIIKNYLKQHPEKFPKLQNSQKGSGWTDAKTNKALARYVADFRDAIIQELGLTPNVIPQKDANGKDIDPKVIVSLREGQILDLSKIKWEEHQPSGWDYTWKY